MHKYTLFYVRASYIYCNFCYFRSFTTLLYDWFPSLGLTQVKVRVKKDGHQFYTNISERKKEDKLKDFDMFSKQGMCCKRNITLFYDSSFFKPISFCKNHLFSTFKKKKKIFTHIVLPNSAALGVKPDCETEKNGTFYAVLANGIQLSCSQSSPNKTRSQTLQPTVPSASCTDQQEQVIGIIMEKCWLGRIYIS